MEEHEPRQGHSGDEYDDDVIVADEIEEIVEVDEAEMRELDDEMDDDAGDIGEEAEENDELVPEVVEMASAGFAHQDSVFGVAASPVDPHLVASCGADDSAFLWDARDGTLRAKLTKHTDSIIAVEFNVSGTMVATAGMDGYVKVSSTATGALLHVLEGPDEALWLAWHPRGDVLLAGASDATIWMWNGKSGACMNVFSGGHAAAVTCGAFTADGKMILSGSDDSSMILWDPKTATTMKKFGGTTGFHGAPVNACACNKSTTLVASGSQDNCVIVSQIKSGRILQRYEKHENSIECLAFSPHNSFLASGDLSGRLCVWDTDTHMLRHSFEVSHGISKLLWDPQRPEILVTSSLNATVQMWDVRACQLIKTYTGHTKHVLDIALTSDGQALVSAGDDGKARVFR